MFYNHGQIRMFTTETHPRNGIRHIITPGAIQAHAGRLSYRTRPEPVRSCERYHQNSQPALYRRGQVRTRTAGKQDLAAGLEVDRPGRRWLASGLINTEEEP